MSRRISRAVIIGATAGLLLGATAQAQAPTEGRLPQAQVDMGGATVLPDVTYAAPMGFRPLKLDLYLPKTTSGPKPAVIWLHGGGWFTGTPRQGASGPVLGAWPRTLSALAARGYVVAGVSYRLSSEARFPAAAQDVKTAIRWLRSHAGEYGVDPSRIAVWGSSAGGQLAALVGVTCGVEALEPPAPPVRPGQAAPAGPPPSDCVQAVVDWYGPADLARMDAEALPGETLKHNGPDSPESRYLGCTLPTCPPDKVRLASAIAFASAEAPPFLIMHGTKDLSVSPEQSRTLYAALKATGAPARLVMVEGVDHSFAGISDAEAHKALDTVFDFLDQTLKAK